MTALFEITDLSVHYPMGWHWRSGPKRLVLRAVDRVSLTIRKGETLGLIGESGSGKSTFGRALLRRLPLAGGGIRFDGVDLAAMPRRDLTRRAQMVFQDPYASLNPRHTISAILAEPLIVHGIRNQAEISDRVAAILDLVGLPTDAARRYPHAFSGGQRQRIGIARALIGHPDFIVADEPVSALDVSVRAQIVNLLQDVKARLGLTTLFIAHDLAVVRHISDRIAIFYAGRLVELAPSDALYRQPLHPYTRALLSAIPEIDPARRSARVPLTGEPPNLLEPGPGCGFASRCPQANEHCRSHRPPLEERQTGHGVACWLTSPG